MVDQRLFSLIEVDGTVDVELCHAFLNSAIALFMLEGMGFGRGDGVLDLNKDWYERHMHLLDPAKLDVAGALRVKASFSKLMGRDVLEIADELEQADRREFDDTVINAFGLSIPRERIYDSLRALVAIRLASIQDFPDSETKESEP